MKRFHGVVMVMLGLALVLPLSACTSPQPDFTLSAAPAALTAGLGGAATVGLTLDPTGGFSGTVDLSLLDASGHPAFGVSVSPTSVLVRPGQMASPTLTVTASSSLPAGSSSYTLNATSGGLSHGTPVTLQLTSTANGTFQSATEYPTSSTLNPISLALADANHDGYPDLIVTNFFVGGPSYLSVLLGNASGTFPTSTDYLGGSNLSLLGEAVGDLNRDGTPDVVATDINSGSVVVSLGNGDGTFPNSPTHAYTAEGGPITIADVNGDGAPDIITANYAGTGVSVLLGNGDGTFQPQQTYTVGTNNHPDGLAAADVNGDGYPDLITANITSGSSGSVSVLLGNGDGTFSASPSHTYAAGTYPLQPVGLAVADIDGDGKLDLITANNHTGDPGSVSVLLGNGDGTFQSATDYGTGSGTTPASVGVGDVNADGSPDIVTEDGQSSGKALVFIGNGDGTFPTNPSQSYAVGSSPSQVVVADVNHDGKLDLIAANSGSASAGSVSVLLGK